MLVYRQEWAPEMHSGPLESFDVIQVKRAAYSAP